MEAILHEATNSRCAAFGLQNGSVFIYNDKKLVSVISNPGDFPVGLLFGPYGREKSNLILAFSKGTLACKILSRTSNLSTAPAVKLGDDVDVPMQIPKKSKLYLEYAKQEKERAQGTISLEMFFLIYMQICTLFSKRNYSSYELPLLEHF
jgi:hypothetical protein